MPLHAALKTLALALGLLFLSSLCNTEFIIKCSNSSEPHNRLSPSTDGVKGRYTLEWCTAITPNDTVWHLLLSYNRKKPSSCLGINKHSELSQSLDIKDLDCAFVCLYTNLDLIFTSCYTIQNWIPSQKSRKEIGYQNVTNNLTEDTFSKTIYKYSTVNHREYTTGIFYFGNVSVSDYEVQLCRIEKNSTSLPRCRQARGQCALASSAANEVACRVRAPPGPHRLWLQHTAPWVGNDFMHDKIVAQFVFTVGADGAEGAGAGGEGGAPLDGSAGVGGALVAACVALGALLAAAALLSVALRCRLAADYRKQVVRSWRDRTRSKPSKEATGADEAGAEAGAGPGAGSVLVLYARECATAEPVIAALCALLETVLPGQVVDLYAARTVARAAGGAGAWLRDCVRRADVRVLLLQTPALQALHAPHAPHAAAAPPLEAPLLCRRALYREPAPHDWLLQYALRIITDTTYLPGGEYRKFYLATLEGMETEALPYTVPFRRYLLPRHTAALLQDLAPGPLVPAPAPDAGAPAAAPGAPSAAAQHADDLSRAIINFVDYARAHPDYLSDELLLL